MAELMTVTLKRTKLNTNGTARYSLPGVRGRIVFGPKIFNGQAPEELVISAPVIAQPDADAAEKATKRAERKAKAEQTREERLKKAEERAAKAEARAAKARERVEKAKAKGQKSTEGATETAASDAPAVDMQEETVAQ